MEILTSIHAFDVLKRHMTSDVEEFWVLALSPNLSLLEIKCISRGTVDACPVHPRDIFRFACLSNASQLILAHNHPDGYLEPSENDLKLTQTCIQIGKILQIPIADHLLIGNGSYSSFLEKKWCAFSG